MKGKSIMKVEEHPERKDITPREKRLTREE